MRFKFIVLFLFLTAVSFCESKEFVKDMHKADPTEAAIHTYGGGELFKNVFNATSMLIYGNTQSGVGKTFNGIVRIALAIGGFSCFCIALFREKFEPLVKNFFLPAVGIMSCILVPRTTVYIQDHLAQKSPSTQVAGLIKVENVPFFLGKLTTMVSTVSYRLTEALESVAHGVNEKVYNWTGHIYAGENIFLTKKCRIANPVIEDNFREFCRECVFRDLGIGLYSKEELIHAPNLLQFLEDKTSNIRTVVYKEPIATKDSKKTVTEFLPCQEAMKKMNALFRGKEGNTKDLLWGELGNEMQFLLGQRNEGQNELKDLIKQQMAVEILNEEIPGNYHSFAAKRAELLQKENQKILGALGARSIVSLRNFFEAVIYIVFPIVVVISLLSFGIQPLTQWMQLVVWVNIWPPFYVVVNFLLSSLWNFRKNLQWGDNVSLTIFTSEGLSDLYGSMESVAAIAMAFIPFLSWILIKGGASQMVQLASSLSAPMQNAASIAAGEKTSGNYNFGNISLESLNGYNTQLMKQSYSGSLAQGSVSIDSGNQTMTYTAAQDELFIKQGDSHLREGISKTQAFNSSIQDSFTASESAVAEASKTVSAGVTETTNRGVGLMGAISKHLQEGTNFNTQNMTSAQNAFNTANSIADEYALSQGMSKDAAIRELMSGGIGCKILGIKGDAQISTQDGFSSYSSEAQSEKAAYSKSFQENLQSIVNLSKGEVANVLGSEDAKLHEDFSHAWNKTESSAEQWRAASTEHQALSNLKSFTESDNLSLHQNLNQRFVQFLNDKYHDSGLVNEAIELPESSPRKKAIIDEFVSQYMPKQMQETSVKGYYHSQLENLPSDPSQQGFEEKKATLFQQGELKIGRAFGDTEKSVHNLEAHIEKEQGTHRNELQFGKANEAIHEKVIKTQVNPQRSLKERFSTEAESVQFIKSCLDTGAAAGREIGKVIANSPVIYSELFVGFMPIVRKPDENIIAAQKKKEENNG